MEKKKGRFWLPLVISAGVYIGIRVINFAAKAFFFVMMFIIGDLMNIVFNTIAVLAVIAGIIIVVYKTRNILIFPLAILITEFVTDVFLYINSMANDVTELMHDTMSEYYDMEAVYVEKLELVSARPFLFFGIALGVAAIAKLVFDRKKSEG